MEKVQGEEFSSEVYENDIDMYLHQFFEEQQIDDIRTAPQNTWSAAMTYIYRHLFKNNNILRNNIYIDNYNINNKAFKTSTCNQYNVEYINTICDYYIYICNTYDKMISISDFSKLTGVSDDIIYNWYRESENSNSVLSTARLNIYQKLNSGREESLANKLASNKNPVAVMAILNHNYNWNLPGVSRETSNRQALSTDQIRQKLLENNTQLAVTSQINAANNSDTI